MVSGNCPEARARWRPGAVDPDCCNELMSSTVQRPAGGADGAGSACIVGI